MVRAGLEWIKRGVTRVLGKPASDGSATDGDVFDSGPADASTQETEDTTDSDGQFIPSRLDASVLEAHGMGSTRAERELESIQEKARTLEQAYPDDDDPR